jgi:glycosyltransferase involved in cell wall biosynthesis
VRITVVICTLQRPSSLDRALASLARCHPPRHADWSVVIVDNAGCAQTRHVVASYRDRLPVKVVVEPEQGLARARNAAIAATDCDYFIWTDDDVTVGRSWVREYEAAFEQHPEAAFFGGPITPRFEGAAPAWITTCLPYIRTAYAGRNLSPGVTKLDQSPHQLPFGANMAIRAREQRQFLYDITLGRQPGPQIRSGEESDCLRRICSAGGVGSWVPAAGVDHWIDRDRQTVSYVWRYYAGVSFGRAHARLVNRPATPDPRRLAARWQLARNYWHYLWGRLTGRPETWVEALVRSARLSGEIAAHREFRSNRNSASRAAE